MTTTTGARQVFAFTPHFYGTELHGHAHDVYDQVKLFVASIIYGNRYASVRIQDPVVLVDALLRKGAVGPASPIGTDYPLLEAAGIVKVKESKITSGRYYLHMVKQDVIEQGLTVLKRGALDTAGKFRKDEASGLLVPSGFTGPEPRRAQIAQTTAVSQIAQENLLRAMRGEDLI